MKHMHKLWVKQLDHGAFDMPPCNGSSVVRDRGYLHARVHTSERDGFLVISDDSRLLDIPTDWPLR